MNDDAKKKILARRAQFVAAALAGVSCGKAPITEPEPCLAMVVVEDAGPAAPPTIDTTADTSVPTACLSVALQPEDAGKPPQPCLGPPAPPPMPCLSRVPPKRGAP